MPAYKYRAVNAQGRITRGQIAAANEVELAQQLGANGFELIEARAKRETPRLALVPLKAPPQTRQRVSRRAVPVFCAQMADLLKAGVPFVEALRDVTEATEPGALRDALMDITRAVNHGSRIADAFARAPRLFPSVFVAILAAGEASGDLTHTFARLARYAEARARTAEQLRRALRYPAFLLLVTLGTVAFMMLLVVPEIVSFLNSINSELPLTTRLLIAASDIIAGGWWIIALGVMFIAAALAGLRQGSERAARVIDGLLLRLPLVGKMARKIALSRFMHSFAILYESGIGIVASLRHARASLGNRVLEAQIDEAEKLIIAGRAISSALDGILPIFALRMIKVGERSGALGKSLYDIAEMQERDVAAATEQLIGSLEPALTLVIGAMLAWVVMAVLGPIYGSLGKLGAMG